MATDDYGEDPVDRPQWSWLAGFIARRALADRGLLAPALVTCLIATTLLAAGPIMTRALADAGLHAALARAATTTRDLQVTAPLDGAPSADLDAMVRGAIAEATAPAGAVIRRQLRSGTFALRDDDVLLKFAWLDDAGRLRYVAGGPPAGVDEVAVPEVVAALLGLRLGDAIDVTSTSTEAPARLRTSGIYEVADPEGVRWWGTAPVVDAEWVRGGFTIYGPLLVDRSTLADTLGVREAWWTAALRIDRVDAAGAERIARRVRTFAARTGDGLDVDTGLPVLLADVRQRLLASRAGVLTMVLQLLLLAVYGLALAARLIVAERGDDTAILRSRGASPAQLTLITVAEAVLVVLPGVIAGPVLARVLVGALDDRGALAAAGLTLEPVITVPAVAMSCVAGVAAVTALAIPTVTAARRPGTQPRAQMRQRTSGIAQRAGVDLALVGIAAVGYWQLRQAAGPLTSTVRGTLGIDPLLVTAPALCLLAGAVIALRVVPMLARSAERVARAGRSLVPALSAWQVARRPRTYARAALLPLLALALGVFAVAYGQTRDAAQAALAVDQVTADVRVTPAPAGDVEPARLAGAYTDVAGVAAAVPVRTDTTPMSRAGGRLGVVAVDAGRADVLAVDDALAAEVAALAGRRPALPVVDLPDRDALVLTTRISARGGTRADGAPELIVLVRDGHGLVHPLDAGIAPVDGRPHDVALALGGLARPIALAGIDLVVPPVGTAEPRSYDIELAYAAAGRPSDANWRAVPDAFGAAGIPSPADVSTDGSRLTLRADLQPGLVFDDAVLHLRPGAPADPGPVPLLVDHRLASTLGVTDGDRFTLRVANVAVDARVTAVVAAVPGLPDGSDAGGALIDLGTLAALSFEQVQRTVAPTAWLLDVDGATAGVARRLRAAPLASERVLERTEVAARQRTDPVALGVTGSLMLGFGAAALLAAVGFVVAAIASIRERVTEFALLRAIGLSGRQLASWLAVEQGVVLAGSLAGGLLLGGAMARLILPYTALDAAGTRPPPGVGVQLDPLAVAGLTAVVVTCIAVVLLVLARPVRRLRLGEVLRAGDER